MSFVDDRVGTWYTSEPRINTLRGYWGSGAHPVYYDSPYSAPKSKSTRTATVQGDRKTATFYTRTGAKLITDKPYKYYASGVDGNGSWLDQRVTHMSTWLSPDILTPNAVNNTSFHGQVSNKINETRTKLLNKIIDQRINMGENVGQAVQTANMLAKPVITLAQAFIAAKKGDWFTVERLLGKRQRGVHGKATANTWLAYYYGWKPVISDINEGLKMLAEDLGTEEEELKFTKNGSFSGTYGPYPDSTGKFNNTFECEFSVKESVTLKSISSAVGMLNSFGLSNPVSTAWELQPMSFVLDWFLPIGSVLSGLSAGNGFEFVSGHSTRKMKIRQTATRNPSVVEYYKPGVPFKVTDNGEMRTEYELFDRVPFYSIPLPRIWVKENPFSTERVLSAISLMRQLF